MTRLGCIAILFCACAACFGARSLAAASTQTFPHESRQSGPDAAPAQDQVFSHGDEHIRLIPTLSAPSVKNGGTLEIGALIKAEAGVKSVIAEIRDGERVVDTIALSPKAEQPSLSSFSPHFASHPSASLWSAKWKASGLQEQNYVVALRVTDDAGRKIDDESLQFSDPVAGLTTPGTTNYLNGGMRSDNVLKLSEDGPLSSSAVDEASGFAYFGTLTNPGKVIKVRLSDFKVAKTLTLNIGEEYLSTALMDAAAGYAYFGTNSSSPGKVIKIRLANLTRVGSLTLLAGEDSLSSAMIDPDGGFAYFGTSTSPGKVVKIQLSDFTRVGSLTLNAGENYLQSAVIDAAGSFAYFGTQTSPGIVVKVQLSDFTRAGALAMNPGENELACAVLDSAHGFAYFGTATSPAQIIKVQLSDFTRAASLTLNSGETNAQCAATDPGDGYAYFAIGGSVGKLARIQLANFSRAGEVIVNSNEGYILSIGVSVARSSLYLGASSNPESDTLIKVSLIDFTQTALLKLNPGEVSLSGAAIDPAGEFAYFVGYGNYTGAYGLLVKVRLSDLTFVSSLYLEPDGSDWAAGCALIDRNGTYAYFAKMGEPGVITKVRLVDFTVAGHLNLNTGEDNPYCGFIDPQGEYAYFGTNSFATGQSPDSVIKVRLSDFTRLDSILLDDGEYFITSALTDKTGEYAYFSIYNGSYSVMKVRLSDFTRVANLTRNLAEGKFYCGIIDPNGEYAYYGLLGSPGEILKVRLSDFSRAGTLTFNAGEDDPIQALIDSKGDFSYWGTYTNPSSATIVKVRLVDFTRAGVLKLDTSEGFQMGSVIDPADRWVFFLTQDLNPDWGNVVKVALNQSGAFHATRFTMPEAGTPTDVNFYSHAASGNVRLSLYDDNPTTRSLLWQSDSTSNTALNGFVTVPIASGTPSTPPTLTPGNYWLAWQTDSSADVPSYTQGASGDGFYLPQDFGAFPSGIGTAIPTSSDEKWTSYITYTAATPVQVSAFSVE